MNKIYGTLLMQPYILKSYIAIKKHLLDLFIKSRPERFEDCMESEFAKKITIK